VNHLTLAELEEAFRVLEKPQQCEELPTALQSLNQSQWETILVLLCHLKSQAANSQVH
jgi:hypothetical protein